MSDKATDIEVASAVGAIDSAAVAAGGPGSAKLERTIAMQANLQRVIPSIMSSVQLPASTRTDTEAEANHTHYGFEVAPGAARKLVQRWRCPYSPGHTTAQVAGRLWNPSGATTRLLFTDGTTDVKLGEVEIAGTGSTQTFTGTLTLPPRSTDVITINMWSLGTNTFQLASTGTIGTPNQWNGIVGGSYAGTSDTYVNWETVTYTSGAWNEEVGNGGYQVWCENTTDNQLYFAKRIVGLNSAGDTLFVERLSEFEVMDARNGGRDGDTIRFSIVPVNRFALFCVALLGDE